MRINPVTNATFNGYLKISVYDDDSRPGEPKYNTIKINTKKITDINESEIKTKNGNIYKAQSSNPRLITTYSKACESTWKTVEYDGVNFDKVYKPNLDRFDAAIAYMVKHKTVSIEVLKRKFGEDVVPQIKGLTAISGPGVLRVSELMQTYYDDFIC